MAVDMIARAMAGSGGGGGGGSTPTIEMFTIMYDEWIQVPSEDAELYAPYKYHIIMRAETEITDNMVVSLINDDPVLFANCGFAIKEVVDNNIEFVAIKDPEHGMSLNVMFSKYNPAE